MNAVEIEEEVSDLAKQPFDANNFPYDFLSAFGIKPTTIKKLRTGDANKSDLGGVLLRNNIHISACDVSKTNKTIYALKESSATKKAKVKYVLATDGDELQAEDLNSGEIIACKYSDFPDHFGFFLSLAGISSVKQINENAFDIRATGRLNKLYVELIKENPDWGKKERKEEMNHFMARIIFCFFAEDTDIFGPEISFTKTIEQMSQRDSSNTNEIISEIFRAMNISKENRKEALIPRWADVFPYLNGGLFSESVEVPLFSKIARSYLIHIGNLDWKMINPDIFGSMIQVIADEEERGFLGMHYTSLPNILKVLNPLFMDTLRSQLQSAENNERKLINLRNRLSKIRVFDPACGSGNFLVIAYKEMRKIEDEINRRRNELGRKTDIPLTNFRGIEIRNFSTEIARLALIIAEYQCDVLYLGQKEALAEFLPLEANNWITCGNALRLDWESLCPPSSTGVKLYAQDLFETPLDQAVIDFDNVGGEVFICGNPPYRGSHTQSVSQKSDLQKVFEGRTNKWKSLDYVSGWLFKAALFCSHTKSSSAFVSTNSICQGQQVGVLWNLIFKTSSKIFFAHTSFKWSNLASHNAGVTVVIVGLSAINKKQCLLFSQDHEKKSVVKQVLNINPYLISGPNIIVESHKKPLSDLNEMRKGNMPIDGGRLLLTYDDVNNLKLEPDQQIKFIRRIYGSAEFIKGISRYCLWIEDSKLEDALSLVGIQNRINEVREIRRCSKDKGTRILASRPHQMREMNIGSVNTIVVPSVSSERRPYLPAGLIDNTSTITNLCFGLFDAPLWNFSILVSKLHRTWISTICGKLKTDFRYSNVLGWNTFPLPSLTEKNKIDLCLCSENILLARENHFPASISQLYNVNQMPDDLLNAHIQNDEVLERIYIGRRFKHDTERLERLFHLYIKSKSLKCSNKNSKG